VIVRIHRRRRRFNRSSKINSNSNYHCRQHLAISTVTITNIHRFFFVLFGWFSRLNNVGEYLPSSASSNDADDRDIVARRDVATHIDDRGATAVDAIDATRWLSIVNIDDHDIDDDDDDDDDVCYQPAAAATIVVGEQRCNCRISVDTIDQRCIVVVVCDGGGGDIDVKVCNDDNDIDAETQYVVVVGVEASSQRIERGIPVLTYSFFSDCHA
jgi:hypothetical protein